MLHIFSPVWRSRGRGWLDGRKLSHRIWRHWGLNIGFNWLSVMIYAFYDSFCVMRKLYLKFFLCLSWQSFLWLWHSLFSQILSFCEILWFLNFFLNWQYFLLFDSHLSLSWALARFLLTDEPILVGNFRGLNIGVQFSYFLGVSQFYLIQFSWNLLSWCSCVWDRLIYEITTCHNYTLMIDPYYFYPIWDSIISLTR